MLAVLNLGPIAVFIILTAIVIRNCEIFILRRIGCYTSMVVLITVIAVCNGLRIMVVLVINGLFNYDYSVGCVMTAGMGPFLCYTISEMVIRHCYSPH